MSGPGNDIVFTDHQILIQHKLFFVLSTSSTHAEMISITRTLLVIHTVNYTLSKSSVENLSLYLDNLGPTWPCTELEEGTGLHGGLGGVWPSIPDRPGIVTFPREKCRTPQC